MTLPKAKWVVRIVIIIGLSILIYSAFFSPTLNVGDHVHSFQVEDENGSVINIDGHSNKPKVVHFWAYWCGQCVAELPELAQYMDKFGASLDIFLIHAGNSEKDRQIVKQLFAERGINIKTYYDSGSASDLFGANMVPISFIIDESGTISDKILGVNDWMGKESLENTTRFILSNNHD